MKILRSVLAFLTAMKGQTQKIISSKTENKDPCLDLFEFLQEKTCLKRFSLLEQKAG